MIKNSFKKPIVGLILAAIVFNFNAPQTNAASTTHIVTTQAQLIAALKSKAVEKIVIKPKKNTIFNIEKMDYNKDLVVYQDKTTLVNNGKFDSCDIIATTNAQATKAVANINKYHRSKENRLLIKNSENDIVLPKSDLQSIASLAVDNCDCDIVNKTKWKSIVIKDMSDGNLIQYGNTNKLTVTGDLNRITIMDGASVKGVYYNQEEDNLDDTYGNEIIINGSLDSIIVTNNLELSIGGSNCNTIKNNIINKSDKDIMVYFGDEEEYYKLDKDNNLVKNTDECESDDDDEDIYDDEDFEEDIEDEDYYDDSDEYTYENGDNSYDNGNNDKANNDTTNSQPPAKEVEDTAYNYKEYIIPLEDGQTTTVYGYFDEAASYEEFLQVNQLRVSLGLKELKWDTRMLSMAETRAVDLIQLFSHTRPNGFSGLNLLMDINLDFGARGENIAAGYNSAAAATLGWKNSPGHYANMTNVKYKTMCVGCIIAKDETDKNKYKYYWVQIFRG